MSELTQLMLGLICILACIEAFERSHGVARYAWRLLAITISLWAIAQTLGLYVDLSANRSLESLDDVLFFLSIIPIGMLPFLDPENEPNSFDRLHLLDFVQVCIFWFSIFLYFSPRMWSPESAARFGPFGWSRSAAFDGLLVVTFVLRALLTRSTAVRSLFLRMAIFLTFSGLADSYALRPGGDLKAGGWFDLIWTVLLLVPVLIAATWKSVDADETDASTKSQSVVINQVFPLVYPLFSFVLLDRLHNAYPILGVVVFAIAFAAVAARMLIIQHRHALNEAQLQLDVADRKRAEEALRASEVQYRLLFESNPVPMWVFDRKTLKFLAVNEAAIRHYQFSKPEFLAMTIGDIRPMEDAPSLMQAISKRMDGLQEVETWRHRKRDGTIIDVEIVGHDLDFHGIEAELVAAHDLTERKQVEGALRQAEENYRSIVEDAVVGIFQSTPAGRYLTANPAMARMMGYDSPAELVASITDISRQVYVDPVRRNEFRRLMEKHGAVQNFELQAYRKDGSTMWISASVRAVCENGVVVGYEGMNQDITDRKVAEERVQFLAYYDALTGLPNRTLLKDRLTTALAGARRRKNQVALLFLDLDRFKLINDSLGHSVGDILLQEVAKRLKSWAREQDTVARLGGDEFLIVLSDIASVPDAAIAAERLMDALSAEFVIQGHSLSISCSLGISIFPEHGTDDESLIMNADTAMYSAKEYGRDNFRFFTEDMNALVVERLNLENGLRQSLDNRELFLEYQPQMDLATGRVTGLETLLRWQNPKLGLVPPDRFIRIAESSGLIVPIGEWVLKTACSQAQSWQDQGLPAVCVAVNVSAVQFRQANFCERIKSVLEETGLAPEYLELELTESLLLSGAEGTLSVLQELKAMGLKLAIDDFGTGYSSLSYLKHFPVGKLKIDRSFVRDLGVSSDDMAITTAIIGMAKSLNFKVIAEGVENETQLSFLRAHRCDEIQGYYFSKPLAVDAVADKLRSEGLEARFSLTTSAAVSST